MAVRDGGKKGQSMQCKCGSDKCDWCSGREDYGTFVIPIDAEMWERLRTMDSLEEILICKKGVVKVVIHRTE